MSDRDRRTVLLKKAERAQHIIDELMLGIDSFAEFSAVGDKPPELETMLRSYQEELWGDKISR